MSSFNWTCPFCNRDTTITPDNLLESVTDCRLRGSDGRKRFMFTFILCPNKECQKLTLTAALQKLEYNPNKGEYEPKDLEHFWSLVPASRAIAFPNYVPPAIREDYIEACLIVELSPKASATLSRRCLQGIIRDFWKVKAGRLVDEIKEIQNKVDPLTWDAIEAVRKIGNIGLTWRLTSIR